MTDMERVTKKAKELAMLLNAQPKVYSDNVFDDIEDDDDDYLEYACSSPMTDGEEIRAFFDED